MDERSKSFRSAPAKQLRKSLRRAVSHSGATPLKVPIFMAGISVLCLLAIAVVQFRQVSQLRREIEVLKAESVRYGQGMEIFNPAWGTVIDAVDPQRFPSR